MWKTLLHRLLASLGMGGGQSPALLARLGLAGGRPSGSPTQAKKPEPYRWRAAISFDAVTIDGETPSAAMRTSLAEAAGAEKREVKDHSDIRADPPAGWEAAARCGLEVLGSLRTGQVFVANNRLTIEGVARDDAGYERIRSLRGGKGERGFSVSAAGVSEPIPAAPLGPPPPEAMPEKPTEKKAARKRSSTKSKTTKPPAATSGRGGPSASKSRSPKSGAAKAGSSKAARGGASRSKRATAEKGSPAVAGETSVATAKAKPARAKPAARPRSRRAAAPAAPVGRAPDAARTATPSEPQANDPKG